MNENFLYGEFIDTKVCDEIISFFEKNKNLQIRNDITNHSQDSFHKKSSQISFSKKDFFNIFPNYSIGLEKVLKEYQKKYLYSSYGQNFYDIKEIIKVQKYEPNEGFYSWHYENTGYTEFKNRHLVFMTFLNSVKDGGAEFLYQNKIIEAKKGYTIIWPSQWTHTHRGQISKNKKKYVVTGWYNYD